MSADRDGREKGDWMRHLLCVASMVAAALAPGALGGPFPPADILVATQEPDGSWDPDWETGYIIPGLVTSYVWSGDQPATRYAPYRTSAENAGMWVLNNQPLIPYPGTTVNPYTGTTTHFLFGQEAYGFQRLSEVNATPAANIWRTEITNFYADVKAVFPVYAGTGNSSTRGFIDWLRDGQMDVSIWTDMNAHYLVAAAYVGAADYSIWRSELIKSLSMVDNDSYFPVLSLGSTVWALASNWDLDTTQVDPGAVSGDLWYNEGAGRPVNLLDLPGILATHQEPVTGSFYWRFDHQGDGFGGPAYGYTEDTVFGTLGLQAATAHGYGQYDVEIAAGLGALKAGYVNWGGYMSDHLWFDTGYGYNFMFAAEGLRVVIPEPGSVLLLACGLAGLLARKRSRRSSRSTRAELGVDSGEGAR
ncbi:MAG: PEP-CTERM sorting domain-containing protein [Planctomycetes bacterium]|nr:PEP-CTERM sorting domain-containing protein [Planctomycetota bacterium]